MVKRPSPENENPLLIVNSTQVPNTLLDDLMPHCSPALWKLVSFVARKTYGWQKRWDAISTTQIEEGTGLSNRFVIDGMAELVKAKVVLKGEETQYGYLYSLNLSCDVKAAADMLEPAKRKPRERPSGGRKKTESTGEPSSQAQVNSVHTPYELSSSEPSSPVPMNPVHSESEPGSQTKQTIKQTIKKGEERPRSPSELAISQKDFWKFFEDLPIRADFDPDRDRMTRIKIAAIKSGLGLVDAKAMLRQHPEWKDWSYLDLIDSQQEISFPEPERKPVEKVTLPAEMDANAGAVKFEYLRDFVKKRVSPHAFDTWFKPLRPLGVIEGRLYLIAPTPEFCHVSDKFHDLIAEANQAAQVVVIGGSEELANYNFTGKETA